MPAKKANNTSKLKQSAKISWKLLGGILLVCASIALAVWGLFNLSSDLPAAANDKSDINENPTLKGFQSYLDGDLESPKAIGEIKELSTKLPSVNFKLDDKEFLNGKVLNTPDFQAEVIDDPEKAINVTVGYIKAGTELSYK